MLCFGGADFCKVTSVRRRLEGSRNIEQRSSRSPRTLIRGRAVAKAPTLWLHGSCLDCQPIRMATARVASFIVTMCPPMALMLPLAGTETSVCRRAGRPRCQALAAPSSRNDHKNAMQVMQPVSMVAGMLFFGQTSPVLGIVLVRRLGCTLYFRDGFGCSIISPRRRSALTSTIYNLIRRDI